MPNSEKFLRFIILFIGKVVEVINEDTEVNFIVCVRKLSVNYFKWPVKIMSKFLRITSFQKCLLPNQGPTYGNGGPGQNH